MAVAMNRIYRKGLAVLLDSSHALLTLPNAVLDNVSTTRRWCWPSACCDCPLFAFYIALVTRIFQAHSFFVVLQR